MFDVVAGSIENPKSTWKCLEAQCLWGFGGFDAQLIPVSPWGSFPAFCLPGSFPFSLVSAAPDGPNRGLSFWVLLALSLNKMWACRSTCSLSPHLA